MSAAPGWYPDPDAPDPDAPDRSLRWWDGGQWTGQVQPHPAAAAHAATWQRTILPGQPSSTAGPSLRRPDLAQGPAGDVWLPPGLVAGGHLPDVCVRHGRPAEGRRRTVKVLSRTPGWMYVLLLPGFLIFAIAVLATRRSLAGSWPVCVACVADRRRHVLGALAAGAGTVAAWLGAASLASGGLALLGVVLFVLMIALADRSSWRRTTSADVDRTSGSVHVRAPSAAFVAALPVPPQHQPQPQPAGWTGSS